MLRKFIVAIALLSFVSVLGCGKKPPPPPDGGKTGTDNPAKTPDDPYPMPRPGS
jgi:hypothetical protein